MKSDLPKVLVPVCGRPMIRYVIDGLREAGVEKIVAVVGLSRRPRAGEELQGEPGVEFVTQAEQLGTGHAVMMAREQLAQHEGGAGGDRHGRLADAASGVDPQIANRV